MVPGSNKVTVYQLARSLETRFTVGPLRKTSDGSAGMKSDDSIVEVGITVAIAGDSNMISTKDNETNLFIGTTTVLNINWNT